MEKQSFAFFDFDGALIPGDSIAAFVRYARKRGIMPRRAFFKALLAAAGYLLGTFARLSGLPNMNLARTSFWNWSQQGQ